MDFLKTVNKNKDQLLKDLIKLLQIDSVGIEQPQVKDAPFGEGVKDALLYMLQLGESMGFATKNIENVAGHIEYGEGKEIIGVLCHLDVVPAGDNWTYPPFSGTVDGDKLYARGAIDDKGPAMSALYALKVLKDLNIKLNKRVRLILGTDEETGMRGVTRYLQVCDMPDLGFSPDADFPIIYGEKGIMSIDFLSDFQDDKLMELKSGDRYNVVPEKAIAKVKGDLTEDFHYFLKKYNLKGNATTFGDGITTLTMFGKSAHAMQPEKGVNALVNLCLFLDKHVNHPLVKFVAHVLNDTRMTTTHLNFTDPEMGDLTMNCALADISKNSSKVGINLRYPINWDKDSFVKEIKQHAVKITVAVGKDSKPHYIDKESALVKTLHQSYIRYTNDTKSPLVTIGGGTYARVLKNAVAFGMLMPGREDVVHKVDEYVYIQDLLTATAIYADALYELGK